MTTEQVIDALTRAKIRIEGHNLQDEDTEKAFDIAIKSLNAQNATNEIPEEKYYFITYQAAQVPLVSYTWHTVTDKNPADFIEEISSMAIKEKGQNWEFTVINTCEISKATYEKHKDND